MLFAFFTANQSDPTTTESKSVNAHVSHDDFGANGTNIFEQSMDLTGGIEIDTEDAAQGVEPGQDLFKITLVSIMIITLLVSNRPLQKMLMQIQTILSLNKMHWGFRRVTVLLLMKSFQITQTMMECTEMKWICYWSFYKVSPKNLNYS